MASVSGRLRTAPPDEAARGMHPRNEDVSAADTTPSVDHDGSCTSSIIGVEPCPLFVFPDRRDHRSGRPRPGTAGLGRRHRPRCSWVGRTDRRDDRRGSDRRGSAGWSWHGCPIPARGVGGGTAWSACWPPCARSWSVPVPTLRSPSGSTTCRSASGSCEGRPQTNGGCAMRDAPVPRRGGGVVRSQMCPTQTPITAGHRRWPTSGAPLSLAARPGLGQLAAVCEAFFSYVERRVFPGGCFFVATALEMGARPGSVRDRVVCLVVQPRGVLDHRSRIPRGRPGGLRGEAGGVVSERCVCRQVVACAASAASRIRHGQCAPGVPVPGVVHARQR